MMNTKYAPNVFNLPNIADKIASYLDEYDVARVRMLLLIDDRATREVVEERCAKIRRTRQIVVHELVTALDNVDNVVGQRAATLLMHDFMVALVEYALYVHLLGPGLTRDIQRRFQTMWSNAYSFSDPPMLFTQDDPTELSIAFPFVAHLLHPHLSVLEI